MKKLVKRMVGAILLLLVATLGIGLATSIKGEVKEARADDPGYTLNFASGVGEFSTIETREYSYGYTYTETKQFGDYEWTLTVIPKGETDIVDGDYLEIEGPYVNLYSFRLRSQMVGANREYVTKMVVTLAPEDSQSSFTLYSKFYDEYYFVTSSGNEITIDGATDGIEEKEIAFTISSDAVRYGLKGGMGEIDLRFYNVAGGVKIKSVAFYLNSFDPSDTSSTDHVANVLSSKVAMANPCNEEGWATLISEYDAFAAQDDYKIWFYTQSFHDRAIAGGPKTEVTTLGTKIAYVRSLYGGGGSGAKVVDSTSSSSLTSIASISGIGFIIIVIGAISLRKRKAN
ncbi:MAG: hypothetical protein K6B65_02080 [Bacilli bacterium]|nr:hypothetical protein [Bacilli bacterium]